MLHVWHLFWRTSANDCFCTAFAHSLLLTRFTLYSTPSSSSSLLLLIISPIFVFGLNLKGFREFKSGILFSLKSLSSLLFSFSKFFRSFSVLFHFFLSLHIKRILSSWDFCPHWRHKNTFMLINKRPYISCLNRVEMWVLEEKKICK